MEYLFNFELEYDEKSPFGKDPDKDCEFLLEASRKVNSNLDITKIKTAFYYCVEKHKDVKRKSGYPYYTHPLNVALILVREFSFQDTNSIIACLLHDTLEDVEGLLKSEIEDLFGDDVAEIVDAVTKISHDQIQKEAGVSKELLKGLTYRKLFIALVKDVRVILIKLADRLHNMRTLHYMSESSQKRISDETLNFYVPIAHRLGLNKIKMELENRAFYYIDRENYEAIRVALTTKRRDFINYIRVFSDLIQDSLNQNNLRHTLTIVHKHEYEIYKMISDGKSLSDIDNFYSIVIVLNTNDIHECYRAHGVLANAFNTTSFIDYISHSKIDWYKSIYTELIGPDGKRIELLIRTEEMEKIAEEGFAAKYSFKSGRIRELNFTDKEIDNWGEWMQDIITDLGEQASQIIWDSIKVNIFDSALNVYTKEGTSISLPQGANLIDFAFALSTETGLRCVTGKVNGVIHDLNYKLKQGDQIEIIKSPNAFPKEEWQKEVVSHRAISGLHKYFKSVIKDDKPSDIWQKNFEARLIIKGEDRARMLYDITEAIGKTNIRRIQLDTSGNIFDGAISVYVIDEDELNRVFIKLLGIRGIKSVEKIEDNE
ncbi:MAG TPA: HD domain-containing protein [Candidatus Kapabacteria bacterium]|nr:HD domain-containing protein [Candidatus Kapabacteria bacterium]